MLIREIAICCKDIEATATFYAGMELKILHKNDTEISFFAGRSILTFVQHSQIDLPVYHFAFNIPHNQISECLEWLEKRMEIIPVENKKIADFPNWNAHAIYTYDNNRNIVEWIARHDLDNASETPFSGNSIDCISEIGLVSEDVPAYAELLSSRYRIPVFSKQPPKENFTALGNDSGLLILSQSGRNWFPTAVAAHQFPVKVVLESEGGTDELVDGFV